ncbi:hypothetical protein NN561_020288 [Cricetulus griseus]
MAGKAVLRPMDGLKESQSKVKRTVRKIILRSLSQVKQLLGAACIYSSQEGEIRETLPRKVTRKKDSIRKEEIKSDGACNLKHWGLLFSEVTRVWNVDMS